MSHDVQKLITQTLDQRADQAPEVPGGDLMGAVVERARATQRRRRTQRGAVAAVVVLVLVVAVTSPQWRGSVTTPAGPATPASAVPSASSEPSSVAPTPTAQPTGSAAESPAQSPAASPSEQAGYNAALALPEGDPVKLTPRAEVLNSERVRVVLPGGTSANGVLLPAETKVALQPRAVAGGGVALVGDATVEGQSFPTANLYLVNGSKVRVARTGLVSQQLFVDPQGRTGLVLEPDSLENPTKAIPIQIDLTTGAELGRWPGIGTEIIEFLGWTQGGLWVLGPDGVSVVPQQGQPIAVPADVQRVARVIEDGVTRVYVLTQTDRGLCQVSFDDSAAIPDLAAAKPDFCIETRHSRVDLRLYQPQPDGSLLVVFDDQDPALFTPQDRRAVLVAPSGSVSEVIVPTALSDVMVAVVGYGGKDLLSSAEPDGCTLWQVGSPNTDDNVVVRWCLNGTLERAPLADDVDFLA